MSHEMSTNTNSLPTSLMSSAPSYSVSSSINYSTALLPHSMSPLNHQLVSSPISAATSSAYQHQSITTHQLPPTPNSLVTMMGPNSGSSNSTSEQLTSTELSGSSISPTQNQQQLSARSPSWSTLPISSDTSTGFRGNISTPPLLPGTSSISSGLQQATMAAVHLHSSHQHQAFANHYTHSFQQARPGSHQLLYNWFN